MADKITKKGQVVAVHPNSQFKVELENGHEAIGHLCGTMKQHNINVMVGDEVEIDISPYDSERGIIQKRLSPNSNN